MQDYNIDFLIKENEELKEKIKHLENLIFNINDDKNNLNNIIENTQTGLWEYNLSTNQLNWTKIVFDIFDLSYNYQITYQSYLQFVHPEDRNRIIETINKAITNKTSYEIEHRIISNKGILKWLNCRGNVFINNNNQTIIKGIVTNITNLLTIRKKITESDEKYKVFFKKNPLPMWVYDPKTLEIIDVNFAAIQKYGYTEEEFLRKTIMDIRPTEDIEKLIELTEKNINTENVTSDGFWRHKKKNGTLFYVEVKRTKINISDKEYHLAIINDITQKILAENALKENIQRYQTLFSRANDAIFIMDKDTFIDCNDKTLEIFACKREEIIGHSPVEFSPEYQPDGKKSSESALEKITNAINGKPQKFYWKHQQKNGNYFDAEVSLNAIEVNNNTFVQAIVRDITEQLNSEKKLLEIQENLKKQNNVLVELSNKKAMFSGSFLESAKEITKAAAKTLTITKSSVWIYHPEKDITSIVTYYLKTNQFDDTSIVLNYADYPEYFKAINTERIIAVKDVYNDSRMLAFSENYFKKYNIKSTLDIPVRVGGEIVAIICNENEEEQKDWTFEEQTFAASLADLLSIAYEDIQRKEIEKKIIENEKILKTILDNIEHLTYKFTITNNKKVKLNYISPQVEKILGIKQEEFSDYLFNKKIAALFHPEDIHKITEAGSKLLNENKKVNLSYRIKNIHTNQYIWIEETIIPSIDESGKNQIRYGILHDITDRKNQEIALKQSEEKYRYLFENNLAGVFITKIDGTFIAANESFIKIFGFNSLHELLNTNAKELYFSTIDRENYINQLKQKKQLKNYTLKHKKKDGTEIWVLANVTLETKNNEEYLQGTLIDITEIIITQNKLKESEKKFRLLSESSPLGVFLLNAKQDPIFLNSKTKEIFWNKQISFNNQEPPKDDWRQFIHPEDKNTVYEIITSEKYNHIPINFEFRIINNNETKWISVNAIRLLNENQKRESTIGTLEDITEKRKNIDRLKQSEKRFRLLADAAIEGIVITHNDIIIDVNDRFYLMHGYNKKEEVIGKNINSFFTINKTINNVESINRPIEIESKKKSGEILTLELKGEKVPFDDKEIRISVLYDISERKKYEEALIESRESYKNLIESSPVGIVILNKELNVKFVNDTIKELFGILPNQTQPVKIWDFIESKQHKEVLTLLENTLSGNKTNFFELNIITSQNQSKTIEAKGILTNYQGEKAIQIVLNDITDRKQLQKEQIRAEIAEETNKRLQKEIAERINAERKLIENQQFTKSIIECSLDMICATNKEGKIIEFNEAASHCFGYSFDEIKNLSPRVLYADEKQFEYVHNQIFNKGNYSGEIINIRKDGSTFISYLSASLLLNPTGEVIGSMGVSRDITESKNAEKQIKDALKEKEILLKEVHHRVKNNLQVISSILNLQSSYVSDENTLNILRESQNRIKSMAFIHESLYQNKDFAQIKFSEYVVNLANNLVQSYGLNNKLIDLKLDIDEVFINLDDSIPCGLIINELVSNALKYAFTDKKQGEIEIKVKNKSEYMYLSVADNGKGLPNNFSIENTQTLGLQLVSSLCEQLNAQLKFSSNQGKGTCFKIEFKLK